MTKLDVVVIITFFVSLLAFIQNYATWAAYKDSNHYYYSQMKNGWWTLFYLILMFSCAYYLEGF